MGRSSLAAAGQWLQARFMYDFAHRPPFDEARGPDAKGEGLHYRCHRAKDGWFFLAGPADQTAAAAARLLRKTPTELTSRELENLLIQHFQTQPVAFWKEQLREDSVAVQPLSSLNQVRTESLAHPGAIRTVRFLRDTGHPIGRVVEHIDPTAIRPLHARIAPLAAPEKYGARTRGVLREMGYSEKEISALAAAEVISGGWSEDYLPD